METSRYYQCKYCFQDFEPKRRRVQKFCSNSCRSKAHHAKKQAKDLKSKTSTLPSKNFEFPKIKKEPKKSSETITAAGIGNVEE
ncbi:hypothetical protein SAMN03097699_1886 [Flavobacteriaceae bacterium MAR_2010_188]|nr:hypothetical protein SAMN03097699_1886 [Flavobacteriaceae bacterium MAR_2010_188]